jgi:putative phosphoesterase
MRRGKRSFRLGVIADTHGLFDASLEAHFAGVDHIVHAGDIGDRSVMDRLAKIAPVTAVSGNVDGYGRSGLPPYRLLELAGRRIALRHIVYEGGRLHPDARVLLDREHPDICIFGHTHRPLIEWLGPMLLFNPGSAGPKRFHLPRAIGLLTIEPDRVTPVHVLLK